MKVSKDYWKGDNPNNMRNRTVHHWLVEDIEDTPMNERLEKAATNGLTPVRCGSWRFIASGRCLATTLGMEVFRGSPSNKIRIKSCKLGKWTSWNIMDASKSFSQQACKRGTWYNNLQQYNKSPNMKNFNHEMWNFSPGGIFSSRIWAVYIHGFIMGSKSYRHFCLYLAVKDTSKKQLVVTRLRSKLCPTFTNELCHGCIFCKYLTCWCSHIDLKALRNAVSKQLTFFQGRLGRGSPESCLTFQFPRGNPCRKFKSVMISLGYIERKQLHSVNCSLLWEHGITLPKKWPQKRFL